MITLEKLKREATQLKKAEGIKHCQALERTAQKYGFKTYAAAQVALKK